MVRIVGRLLLLALMGLVLAAGLSAQDKKPAQEKSAAPRPAPPGADLYKLGPDSEEHPDVPKGRFVAGPTRRLKSKIYPNTERDYALYIPANYDKDRPHRVMVFQDGVAYANRNGQFRVPVVLDNLIHKKELSPIICIFMQPGYPLDADGNRITDESKKNAQRSLEYDTLSPKYAEFLEKEVLPKIGGEFNLTKNPSERAICGLSSGGICALTVAWERPDLFRKVISHYGSFTNIRGGHAYSALVRKSIRQPKPIRVFLQAGANDLDNEAGNWALANLQMAAALKYAKYDFRFEYGVGGHSGHHGGSILPETLKWLWRTDSPSSSGGERTKTE